MTILLAGCILLQPPSWQCYGGSFCFVFPPPPLCFPKLRHLPELNLCCPGKSVSICSLDSSVYRAVFRSRLSSVAVAFEWFLAVNWFLEMGSVIFLNCNFQSTLASIGSRDAGRIMLGVLYVKVTTVLAFLWLFIFLKLLVRL